MSHVRTQIRDAVKAALDSATGLSGHTIFAGRRYAINAASLPLIDMKFLNENVERNVMGKVRDRVASLYIRASHEASDDELDNELDDVAIAIEHAMDAAGDLDGVIIEMELIQTNFADNAEGDKALAELVLRYDLLYRVDKDDVETAKG